MTTITEPSLLQLSNVQYELSSFVRHEDERDSKSLESGHYVSVIRSGSTWFEMSDTVVIRKSPEAVQSEIHGSRDVYYMVYSRV